MGGAPVLDGRHLTGRRNNQPNDSVGGGGGIGEELRASGTRGGLHLLVGSGDKLSGGKNKNRERVRRDKQMSWRTVYFFYLKMGKKFSTD